MPSWLASILISMGVYVVEHFGIPVLEAKFPKLVPLLDEILAIIHKNTAPTAAMHGAAETYETASTDRVK